MKKENRKNKKTVNEDKIIHGFNTDLEIFPVLVYNPLVWYKPDTWLYALIRKFTKTEYNHIVIFAKLEDTWCVVDANFNGVLVRGNAQVWLNKEKRRLAACNIPINVSQDLLKNSLLEETNKGYDFLVYLTYIKFMLINLFKKQDTIIKTKSNNRNYCFELVAKVYLEKYLQKLIDNELFTSNDFKEYIFEVREIL